MQDKTSGFVVQNYLSDAIDVDTSNAQWLEVNNLPNTEILRLSDKGDSSVERKYLQLNTTPKLQRLQLTQTPWVLHLDLTDNHNLLNIQGNIEHFDYCYDGGGYLHSHAQLLKQVVICPVDRVDKNRRQLENLEPTSLLVIHARRGSEVPKQLQLRTLAQVSLVALHGAEKVTFESVAPASVGARDCRNLRCIKGEGERLRLTECGKNQIHIGGSWNTIELVSCRVERLTIDDAHLLTLRGMVRIKNTHVPDYMRVENHASHYFQAEVFPDINESTLTRLYEVIESTEGEEQVKAVSNMFSALRRCYRPSTRFHGICLLLALARHSSGYDSDIARVLSKIMQGSQRELFTADRQVEGWLNYMALWRLLINRACPVVEEELGHSNNRYIDNIVSFFALVMTLLENANSYENEQKALRKVMLQAMRQGVFDTSGTLKLLPKLQRRLLIALPKLDELTQLACIKFLLINSKTERQRIVQKLLQTAPKITRKVALHLANRFPEQRTQYMAIALGSAAGVSRKEEGSGLPEQGVFS